VIPKTNLIEAQGTFEAVPHVVTEKAAAPNLLSGCVWREYDVIDKSKDLSVVFRLPEFPRFFIHRVEVDHQ